MAIAIRGGGLAAPAIHDADKLSLDELMARMRDLVQRTRAGRIRSSEIADSTITVSSLGERGVEALYGIIYPPQVAIVGFGKVVVRPWVIDGAIGPRSVVTITACGRPPRERWPCRRTVPRRDRQIAAGAGQAMTQPDIRTVVQEELSNIAPEIDLASDQSHRRSARGARYRFHGLSQLRHRRPSSSRRRYPRARLSEAHHARWGGEVSREQTSVGQELTGRI